MISEADLNQEALQLTPQQRVNFPRLFEVCNEIERRYLADGGRPLKVSRGVSSVARQHQVDPQHPDDAHVKGAGVDFFDWDHRFYHWCESNLDVLEEIGLWMESIVSAKNHVHLQTYAPKSGKRIFLA